MYREIKLTLVGTSDLVVAKPGVVAMSEAMSEEKELVYSIVETV